METDKEALIQVQISATYKKISSPQLSSNALELNSLFVTYLRLEKVEQNNFLIIRITMKLQNCLTLF